jgi:hypothetical protein
MKSAQYQARKREAMQRMENEFWTAGDTIALLGSYLTNELTVPDIEGASEALGISVEFIEEIVPELRRDIRIYLARHPEYYDRADRVRDWALRDDPVTPHDDGDVRLSDVDSNARGPVTEERFRFLIGILGPRGLDRRFRCPKVTTIRYAREGDERHPPIDEKAVSAWTADLRLHSELARRCIPLGANLRDAGHPLWDRRTGPEFWTEDNRGVVWALGRVDEWDWLWLRFPHVGSQLRAVFEEEEKRRGGDLAFSTDELATLRGWTGRGDGDIRELVRQLPNRSATAVRDGLLRLRREEPDGWTAAHDEALAVRVMEGQPLGDDEHTAAQARARLGRRKFTTAGQWMVAIAIYADSHGLAQGDRARLRENVCRTLGGRVAEALRQPIVNPERDPHAMHRPWTADEERILLEAHPSSKGDFREIASQLGRSPVAVRMRFSQLSKPTSELRAADHRRTWTAEDDARVIRARPASIEQCRALGAELGRTWRAIRNRWNRICRPLGEPEIPAQRDDDGAVGASPPASDGD